ncbi:membrane protein [Caballeronia arvi]|uniref:Membrane protein n=1 Tax=Caballeronia arvi TaxID=1777135 RepID=A0A158F164_9BURK|nr:membrane protein [Caballeronia arvi]
MIKAFVPALVIATALAAPTFAFAQSNAPVTRAQVRAELVQLEKAGYNPSEDRVNYPQNLQAAQARVNAENGGSAYGPSTAGTSQSGAVAPVARANVSMSDRNSVYFGH